MTTADLYEAHLHKIGVTSFGRAWDIGDSEQRRACAEWLAEQHRAVEQTGDMKSPPPAWQS